MNKKNMGKNIQILRKICGMTQAELADRVGVSADHISHIEIGSGSISLSLLLKICTLLNAERHVRRWCDMQGAQKMKGGPSAGIEQADLSNHSNTAVVKPMVVSD